MGLCRNVSPCNRVVVQVILVYFIRIGSCAEVCNGIVVLIILVYLFELVLVQRCIMEM